MGNATKTQPTLHAVLSTIASGHTSNRASLARTLGLSPSTTALHVEALIERGIVEETGTGSSTGGRPPRSLSIRSEGGSVVGVDLGERHMRLLSTDLAGRRLAHLETTVDIATDPSTVANQVAEAVALLTDQAAGPLLTVGVAIPGPVAYPSNIITKPSRMPQWDGVDGRQLFSDAIGVETRVDNDANLLALGECATYDQPPHSMIAIKLSRGIGCGVVSGGQLLRGQNGAAGDISHSPTIDGDGRCDCGRVGCLEASASGAALVRRAADRGVVVNDPSDLVALAIGGDREAHTDLRAAGHAIGTSLARFIDFFNPAVLTLGGLMSTYSPLTAALRSAIHDNAMPLATEHLHITTSSLGPDAIAFGAAQLALTDAIAHFSS